MLPLGHCDQCLCVNSICDVTDSVATDAACVLAELEHKLAESSEECLRIKVRENDSVVNII